MKIEEIPPIENVELEVKIAYGKINQLVDLVNSQQEAIEKLEKRLSFFEVYGNPSSPPLEPADDKPKLVSRARYAEKLGIHDTHRTVTLRIPKGMTIGEIMWRAFTADSTTPYAFGEWLALLSDTDLQKALDEVQPNE